MAVSIKSIAEDLGLSKATVSWILSGKGEERGFSAMTITQVKKYAKKVGYRPNLIARSLSVGSTKTIALIIPSISDTFYSQMAQGVEARSTECGYVMLLGSSEGDATKERQLIQTFRSQQVAGLIVAPTNKSDAAISDMLKDNFPFVLIDRYVPGLQSNYVISDNEECSYDLVSHLAEQQCRNIALVTTDTHLFIMNKRRDGYMRALAQHGIVPDPDLIVDVDRADYENDIICKMDELLSKKPDVDSIFFTTHYLAEEAIRYFVSKNINYNRRFRLASMHSTKVLEILAPKMSRGVIPVGKMGGIALDILLKNISSAETFVPEGLTLEINRYLI